MPVVRSQTADQRRYAVEATAGLSAAVFAIMLVVAMIGPRNQFDLLGSRTAIELEDAVHLRIVASVLTSLGSTTCLAVVAVTATAGLLWTGRRSEALGYVVACAVSSALVTGVKLLVGRPRPSDGLVHATGYAFPSGHATNSTVVYGLLALMMATGIASMARRRAIAGAAGLIIAVVAVSRVLLNVHWITDVIGGVSLGTVIVTVTYLAVSSHSRPPRSAARGRASAEAAVR